MIDEYLRICNELDDIAVLEEGWYYGLGNEFQPSVIDNAKKAVKNLIDNGYQNLKVFPDTDGEILIFCKKITDKENTISIEVEI